MRRDDWLSPEEYQRLTPAERQMLWRQRKLASPRRRKSRLPKWQRSVFAFVGGFALITGVNWTVDRMDDWRRRSEAVALAAPAERVTFSLCVWGGRTNCVVDGDTIYLHGTKIRIAGIDAPETHDFQCPAEKALGDRATTRLQELLNSGPVTLSRIDRDEDVYGRKLRNVAVNGADVGETLISEGLSRAYRGAKMGWC